MGGFCARGRWDHRDWVRHVNIFVSHGCRQGLDWNWLLGEAPTKGGRMISRFFELELCDDLRGTRPCRDGC